MSPLERILSTPWQLGFALLITFVHGWVLWFVLGQNFSRTVLMTTCSRAVVGAGTAWLIASGVLGRQDPVWQPAAPHWVAAGATAWLLCWSLEVVMLGLLMRRMQAGWSWRAYDLAVLGLAQGAYLAGGWLLLG